MTDDRPTRAPYRLSDAIAEQPAPPCETCKFSRVCIVECRPFRDYVLTGKRIEPPRTLPSVEHGG